MLHSGKVCTTDGERTVPRLWRLPQLKRGVEHDYHIYTWNSACTMEGIDMAMVWNSLLNEPERWMLQNVTDIYAFVTEINAGFPIICLRV